MLLRSSSTPSLTSCFQHQNHKPLTPSQTQQSFIHQNINPNPQIISLHSPKNITRSSSEGDLVTLSRSLCNNININPHNSDHHMMFSWSELDVDEGCHGGSSGGGKICGGGGGDEGYYYNGDGNGMDGYYRRMVEGDPSNSLVLGNYAKYLKEVRGDVLKAEEYCSRAILANPCDGTALSMYADLIWETQNDASRAQSYFDQAVNASPDDSYVMAAYARFLWDADEEESDANLTAPGFLHEASLQLPIAAAS
ncbi:hypothetical protein M8C21_010924 [Ambrosia artemisiifolia]|uniref:Uncharacterized protein n=1 Tax=Ambrosia artemisiifolia TaxID=4212 RepID=A0AAD5CLI6_AMBAR|nr:hypothetical protein M8C21_010924 [Ambrosia artemisiifolia]